jgi:hypothetical protein
MTYKAFVESQQKSPGKRRRMISSSDAITQEVSGWEETMSSEGKWGEWLCKVGWEERRVCDWDVK